jgi:hypothetical protein
MKGLTAWIAGVALIGSLVAPALLKANQGEDRQIIRYYPGQANEGQTSQTIRYYPAGATCVGMDQAGVTYVPTGTTYTYSAAIEAVPIAEPGMMIAGNRIYYISDNPQYDLSGSNESIYLVNDGTTYHAPSARSATFAAAVAGVPTQVVAVPAEYRQDWLAVAAGDRPVRCIPAMGAVEVESGAPAQMTTSETTDHGVTYTDTGTKYVNRSSQTRHVTHHRKSHYKSTNTAFVQREPAQTEVVESEHVTATAAVVAATPAMGELFQIGNRWYMQKDGDWSRSDSWRGPFVPVKKGHVPREVRESAKRDHSMEE